MIDGRKYDFRLPLIKSSQCRRRQAIVETRVTDCEVRQDEKGKWVCLYRGIRCCVRVGGLFRPYQPVYLS